MEFRTHFRHMDTSEALRDYAEKKLLDSVKTYVHKPLQLTVTFEVDAGECHTSCNVFGDGLSLQVEARTDTNMYTCIDLLQDKLEQRLRRRKDRLTDHKREGAAPEFRQERPEVDAEGAREDDLFDDEDLLAEEEQIVVGSKW